MNRFLRCNTDHRVLIAILGLLGSAMHAPVAKGEDERLVNPGFEQVDGVGRLAGWTILSGLDPHGYGRPAFEQRFDAIIPTRAENGYHSTHCLAFPERGTWFCPIFEHSNGDGDGINGKQLGKAAVFQTVRLNAGRYRLSAWLRTAGGAQHSAAFRLGINVGEAAAYAPDDSTGIQWTKSSLGVRRSEVGGVAARGEWARYETEPVVLDSPGRLTAWIRFDYANENQFPSRWQVDDVAVIRDSGTTPVGDTHVPCVPAPTCRFQSFPGDEETWLVDAGESSVVNAPEKRLFRHARELLPGQALRFRFPPVSDWERMSLLVCWSGAVEVTAGALQVRGTDDSLDEPRTSEWTLRAGHAADEPVEVIVSALDPGRARVYEVELSAPSRTAIRLAHIEADVIDVPWVVGVWDATGREFAGVPWQDSRRPDLETNDLISDGTWRIRFDHRARPGHRYYFIHGLIRGRSRIDVGDDGIVDWVAEQNGEEIVDVDVTDQLVPGENVVVVESTGEHDFAALVEVCPGSTDLRAMTLSFEGDALAENLTRVVDNTWFWLRELHCEPSGFLDASIPHGKWFNQLWPIDIAFALREWVRWGRQGEAERIARLTAAQGWRGHDSNRSGGWDNTAGNIIAQLFAELIRRSGGDASLTNALWPVLESHASEIMANAEESAFGLIRGTNWENAGNRENGPCYALSTSLGAAQSLRQVADLGEWLGKNVPAGAWRARADDLRQAVLDQLVFKADHRSTTGFVYPAGTWAYGLRPDETFEDQPLAGYFWAAGGITDTEALVSSDRALLQIHDRTLIEAVRLFERGEHGIVSGYATSYDGPEVTLVLAALCDRIDLFDPLLRSLTEATDFENDKGALLGELSRWAQGGPDFEDTNLVCAGGFIQPFRILAGIDDLLVDGSQLQLVPRLPWRWTGLRVNGWPVRFRDDKNVERWTRLWFVMDRTATTATARVRTDKNISRIRARLGPFPLASTTSTTRLNGKAIASQLEVSGDAKWVWVEFSIDSAETRVEVSTK